jgi:hypothetical protein
VAGCWVDVAQQRCRIEGRWAGDGLQADRVRAAPLAHGQRPHLVALVRAGAIFVNGKLIERPEDEAADEA